jgi:type II secretory pathway pseudopilin PulG
MRPRERGATLVELLVATLIGSIVLLGVTTFYLSALRFSRAAEWQVAVQRVGSVIAEDVGTRLRAAQFVDIEPPTAVAGNCMPLSTSDPVLVVRDQASVVWCYYRDTSTPPQIVRCSRQGEPLGDCIGGSLLSGSLTSITAPSWTVSVVTPCVSAGGTCGGGVCSIAFQSCATVPGATVAFALSDGTNDPLAFGLGFVFQRH